MRLLVLQHVDCEHPGALGEAAAERGIELEIRELDRGDAIPDPRRYDGLVVLGGPMNVDEEEAHPWLAPEKEAIRAAVEAELPYLGICLGAQLLARALGAAVYPAAAPEVGVGEVRLTAAAADDPLFAGLPDPLPCLQWHGDTFDLPPGAILLATSEACRHQAFRVGPLAWGLQFHVEATPAMAREWGRLAAYRDSAEAALGPGALERVHDALAAAAPRLRPVSGELLDAFTRAPCGTRP